MHHLIERLRAIYRELGSHFGVWHGAPALGEEAHRKFQLRRFRTQAIRGAEETAYYAALFKGIHLNPKRLSFEDIRSLPLTTPTMLRDQPDAFIRHTQHPALRTLTGGATSQPTSMVFTRREVASLTALAARSFLLQKTITPQDIVQVTTSAQEVLANTIFMDAAQQVGAMVYQTGLIEADQTLALLAEPQAITGKKSRPTILLTYPSYLGKLVETGLSLGYTPADFGLEHLFLGGEIVTAGVKRRCRALFGQVEIHEGYNLTETWPVGGIVCDQGHLHFDPAGGLVEVINPETNEPARPGQVGSLVLTPFAPYQEAMILLRYDTQELVRVLAGPFTCSLKHLPATSYLLGKKRYAVRHARGWSYPREVLEAIESTKELPLPARCGFWAIADGVAVQVVVPEVTASLHRSLETRLWAHGVPVRKLILITEPAQLANPLPLRGDLAEGSFAMPQGAKILQDSRRGRELVSTLLPTTGYSTTTQETSYS